MTRQTKEKQLFKKKNFLLYLFPEPPVRVELGLLGLWQFVVV